VEIVVLLQQSGYVCGLRATALAYSKIFLLRGVFRQTWEVGFRSQRALEIKPATAAKHRVQIESENCDLTQ
jgi:hypothetical protein